MVWLADVKNERLDHEIRSSGFLEMSESCFWAGAQGRGADGDALAPGRAIVWRQT